MPVYQYACTECDEEFEVRQSFTDASLTVCPVCEGRLRKVLNAVGVVFKGSGFYRNDSRADKRGASAGTTSSDSGTTTSTPDKAGDKSGSVKEGAAAKGSGDSGSKPKSDSGSGSGSGSGGGKDSSSKKVDGAPSGSRPAPAAAR